MNKMNKKAFKALEEGEAATELLEGYEPRFEKGTIGISYTVRFRKSITRKNI